MSTQLYQDIMALTARAYQPCVGLDEQLGGFLKAAMKYVHAGAGRIKVCSSGSGTAASEGFEVYLEEYGDIPPKDTIFEDSPHLEAKTISQVSLSQREKVVQGNTQSTDRLASKVVTTPILYHQELLGEIVSKPASEDFDVTNYQAFQELFARELAFFIKRHHVNSLARLSFGKPMMLIGASNWLRRVDHFIERASAVDLPVIISGSFGTEKAQVACAIHFSSGRRTQPLVEISAHSLTEENFHQRIMETIENAKGGSVFLNEADQMTPGLQNKLAAYIQSGVGQWLGNTSSQASQTPRWIASITEEVSSGKRSRGLTQSLAAELDFLKVRIAPLAERPQDVGPLIGYAFEKYKIQKSQRIHVAAMALLEGYSWPENVYEVERVIARLATLGNPVEISIEDVVQYAPQLIPQEEPGRQNAKVSMVDDEDLELCAGSGDQEETDTQEEDLSPAQHLIRRLLQNDFTHLNGYHLGLQRALRYLAKHFHEELSLSDLSEQAFMSASHLSHLFKAELGESFKGLLNLLRIEKAQQMLTDENAMRITDVAFESGFGDLSHFTKTFKKIAGCNPKDYRLKYGETV